LKALDQEIREARIDIAAGRSLKEVEKEMILRTLKKPGAIAPMPPIFWVSAAAHCS
jgi:hypothetical protein